LGDQRPAAQKDDGKRRAESRSLRDAEKTRLNQRIAEEQLKDHARGRERHAEQKGGQQARQAQVEEQALGEFVICEALEGDESWRGVTSNQCGEEEDGEQGESEESERAF